MRIAWQQPNVKDPVTTLPRINLQNVGMINGCSPTVQSMDSNGDMFMVPTSDIHLSHLALLSPSPKINSKETTCPTLLAVFSHVPDQFSNAELRGQAYSILSTWDLEMENLTTHPSFSQLASKRTNSSSNKKSKVRVYRQQFHSNTFAKALAGKLGAQEGR